MKSIVCFLISILLVSCGKREPDLSRTKPPLSDCNDTKHLDNAIHQAKSLEKRKFLEGLQKFGIGEGYSPAESPIREALMFLLSSEDGWSAFDEMVESPNWVTTLYGLVGLFYTRPAEYPDYVDKVRRRAHGATVMIDDFTDVECDEPVLVESFLWRPDGYRLYYGETLPQHCWRKNLVFDTKKLDFFGGSIPVVWLDLGSNFLMLEGGTPDGENMPDLHHIDGTRLSILRENSDFYTMWTKCFSRAMKQ